jgi:hypothetical protein
MLVSHEISQNWLLMHTAFHLKGLWYREKLEPNHQTNVTISLGNAVPHVEALGPPKDTISTTFR